MNAFFFFSVDILKCTFKTSVSHFNIDTEIMSTQLKYLVNQITFSVINDDAEPWGGPLGSSIKWATHCLAPASPDCFGDGSWWEGGPSLPSNPKAGMCYRRDIFLCHFRTVERQEIDDMES